MAERDYAGVLPTTPPDDLLPWLQAQGLLLSNLLIYKMGWQYDPVLERKVQTVQLTCTHCGDTVSAEKVEAGACCHAAYSLSSSLFGFIHPETNEQLKNDDHCLCPSCGVEVTIKHVSRVTDNVTCEDVYPLTVSRYEDKLVLIGWLIRKWFTKEADSGIAAWPYEAYVVEQKGIVRLNAYIKYMSTLHLTREWKQLKRFYDIWGKSSLVYPWDPALLVGSTAENSKLDRFLDAAGKEGTYPMTYLRLWQKHPNIENLVMQGASPLLVEAIDTKRKDNNYYGYGSNRPTMPILSWINWKQSSPSKMLGMTKTEYKACLHDKWDLFTLKFWQDEKEAGRALSTSDMVTIQFLTALRCIEVRNTESLDYLKVARYLYKQHGRDSRCDFQILRDYWRIARELGLDLSLQEVRYPPRLMAAHDRVEQMRKWREEAKKAAERAARKDLFEERYEQLLPFCWEHDGILIRPVRDEAELIREGEKLHHCVGMYASRHAKGNTALFLIRRVASPEDPWYTLELNEKTLGVLQNRGDRNCERTEEITAFEAKWLAWCRGQLAAKKKKRRKRDATADRAVPRAAAV